MKATNVVLSLGQKPEITAGNKSTYNKKTSGWISDLVSLFKILFVQLVSEPYISIVPDVFLHVIFVADELT